MDLTIFEILAFIVGIMVVAIETVIIFLLIKHTKALKSHISHGETLMNQVEKNICDHLDHLNNHSHKIEKMLEKICKD